VLKTGYNFIDVNFFCSDFIIQQGQLTLIHGHTTVTANVQGPASLASHCSQCKQRYHEVEIWPPVEDLNPLFLDKKD
jgi:hypothetical protein